VGLVGGDPDGVRSAETPLHGVADRVADAGAAIDREAAAGVHALGAADPALALERFQAAASRAAEDTGVLFRAAGTLAGNAGADLAAAGRVGGRVTVR
jgi:hypothetical protein